MSRADRTSSAKEGRALRADARRNRDRIMEVARDLFEEHGPDVEMDEVAHRSGVGVGTIYRHFPTKEALILAVLAGHVQRLVDAAKDRLGVMDPGAAFFEYLELLAREFLARGRLHQAVAQAGIAVPDTSKEREEFRTSLSKLLSRAQKAGAIRDDVTSAEVILLVRGALFPTEEVNERARRRMFDVVRRGLRP